MSIYDDFRVTAAELFAQFGVPATITSTGSRTRDFVTGDVVTAASATRNVLAALGRRRTVADDGTVTIKATAVCNTSAKPGDTLTMAGKAYTIGDVEDAAPDGGEAMSWVFTLR